MCKPHKLSSLFLTVIFLLGVLFSGAAAAPTGSVVPPDRANFIVGFQDAPSRELVESYGGELYKEFTIINAIAAKMSLESAGELSKKSGIKYVERDAPVFALELAASEISQKTPWGIDRVFGNETYPFSTWEDSSGEEISVAVLDTGIDKDHEDLIVAGGTNTIDKTNWGNDGHGHGTHVAGTISALDNDVGVVGVSPNVYLYAVKVLDDNGSGTTSSVIGGIEWAVDNNISVLNMSLGQGSDSTPLKEACDAAYQKGHLLVAAAGNSGNPPGRGDSVIYPAKYDSVIAVSASDENDKRTSWSSTGPAVELIAPGDKILSTVPGNAYEEKRGTSMASPHAAGVAALTWAANITLKNVEVREILQNTAEDLNLNSNHQGYGLARADLAVTAALEVEPSATGNIKGKVTKDVDEIGIEGAVVEIEGTSFMDTTDEEGNYLLENIPVGDHEVTASADGYYSNTITVTVEEDATVTEDFILEDIPTYTVSGTVTDAEKNALEYAAIAIKETGQSTTTDSSGYYSIADVEQDTYIITASKDGYKEQSKKVTVDSNTTVDFTLEKHTESEGDLSIDKFELTNTSNPAWARVSVDWEVSSNKNELDNVKTEMILLNDVIDSKSSSVTGYAASGKHELRVRSGHGKTYNITLTVTDVNDNSFSVTKEIDL